MPLTKAGRKLVASSSVKTGDKKHGNSIKSLPGRFTLDDSGRPNRVTLERPVSL